MADTFARGILRIVVAQICQNMGWHAVHTTPLELLVDILHRYLEELGKTTHRYSEQFGRTIPNLDDVALAFKDIGIPTGELEDFVNNVEPVSFIHEIPKFPQPRPNNFQFPNPESREVQSRMECIHEHLPLMYPEAEEEEYTSSPATVAVDGIIRKDSISNGAENGLLGESPRSGIKRPLDIEALMHTPKRARIYAEDEGRPMREVTSVFMTPTGVISPAREGRLPDARTPSKLADDSCPSSPISTAENSLESKKETKKEGKKELKKEEKKGKEKKDKKEVKKKSGKKEKDKKENKENKKKDKSKLKSKLLKAGKDSKTKSSNSTSLIARIGSLGKLSDKSKVKAIGSKSKLPKQRQNKLKTFFSKSKHKEEKYAEFTKFLKVKSKKKSVKSTLNSPKDVGELSKQPKTQKSGKSNPVKTEKADKSAPSQIKTLVIKPPVKEKEISSSTQVIPEPTEIQVKSPIKVEPFQHLSGEDSPERLVIDDNPETIEQQERESRMAALNESIDAAIQRGLEETEKQQEESNRSYYETIEDVIRQGMVECQMKTEPRDIYDFTDDEISPPMTPVTPRTPDVAISPVKKKTKKESPETGRKVKDKIKEKIKQKSKEPKTKTKSPLSINKVVKTESSVELEESHAKASESSNVTSEQEPSVSFQTPFPRLPGLNHFSHHLPYFSQIPQIPPALLPYPPPTIPPLPSQFQSLTPPNMPMPPVGFYVRNPRPDSNNLTGSPPGLASMSHCHALGNGSEKSEDTPIKVKQEKSDEVEKTKTKEHKKEKKEKGKEKESAEKDANDNKEKGKTKKKKERVKEKDRKKSDTDKEKSGKTKGKEGKEKGGKTKDKPKEKDKMKTDKKEKKKKEEKQSKEDKEVAGSPNSGSGIPKITFKLGNTSATEGTKIVIKSVMPREGSQSSRSSSPLKETSPPLTPSVKSHPKPQSKVNPVPPAPKSSVTSSSAPTRTVITETVGTIIDEQGNKIWICPACTRPDDGSPMIGCDECDDWYHWVCVGIVVPPKEEENWFCTRCINKKQSVQKKKKKKHRKDKAQT